MWGRTGIVITFLLNYSILQTITKDIVYTTEDNLDWTKAYQKCKENGSHLPSVEIVHNAYKLKDSVTAGGCFWLEAVRHIATDILTKELPYPGFCCGSLSYKSGSIIYECMDCMSHQPFVCISDSSNRVAHALNYYVTWIDARDHCMAHGHLPFVNDTEFQLNLKARRLESTFYWMADIRWFRSISEENEQHECGYWCEDLVFGSCVNTDRHLKAYCIFVQTGTGSTIVSNEESTKDMATSRAGQIKDTTAPISPSQTMYKVGRTTSITKQTTTLSTKLWDSSYANLSNSPSSNTNSEPGIWPILGGTLGSLVVIIIVAVVIIMLLRRRRGKKCHNTILKCTASNKPTVKVQPHTNPSYDTHAEDMFTLEAQITTSQHISNAQFEEPVMYAKPLKAKKKSRNSMDDQFNISQMPDDKENTDLYSIVHEPQEANRRTNKLKDSETDEYDITFMQSGTNEFVENVYNIANFDHPKVHEELTLNVYDKANFHHEVFGTDEGNGNEKAKFNRPESSNYDTTFMSKPTVDSTYDRLK